MAAVYQRGKKKAWYGVFRDSQGKQRWIRLAAAKNRKEALREADHWQTMATDKKGARKARAVLNDLFNGLYGEENQQSQSVRACLTQWLGASKPEVGPATFEAYSKTVHTFLDFLGGRADTDIAQVTRKDLIDFRKTLADSRAPGTCNRYVRTLRMIFKAAHRDNAVPTNPAEHVAIVKSAGRELAGKRAFTIPELQAVLAVADGEWASLIKFGLYTGQRLSDLATLTWANIDLNQEVIRLTTRKTRKPLTIPIAAPLVSHISQLPSSDLPTAPVHPRAFGIIQSQGKAAVLSNQFAELLVDAGLRTPGERATGGRKSTNPLSFHSLRHTAGSLLKDAGIPQAVVEELIGHDSAAMSAVYTHVDTEAWRKAAASLPENLGTKSPRATKYPGEIPPTSPGPCYRRTKVADQSKNRSAASPFRKGIKPMAEDRSS
jgi:integrase